MAHLYVLATIALTVYGQLAFKWQVDLAGAFPAQFNQRVVFLVRLMLNPWIISTYIAVALASLFWLAAMMQLELSYAYPFMSLTFAFVLVLSALLLNEPLSRPKIIGVILIMAGVVVGSQG